MPGGRFTHSGRTARKGTRRRRHGSRVTRIGALAVASLVLTAAAAGASAPSAVDWPAFLFGTSHGSTNASAVTITPANADSVSLAWRWMPDPPTMPGQPGRRLFSSPTVVNGRIYIGADTGVFSVLDEQTGSVVWQRFLGFVPHLTCGAHGLVSTATVARDPATRVLTVYVYSPDGYLYALRASDGAIAWRSAVAVPSQTQNDYLAWSSPTVLAGRVYVGVAGFCGLPPVAGGVKMFDQTTGTLQATYSSVPAGETGGGVWSSVAVDAGTGSVFVTTGNTTTGNHTWIARLDGQTLVQQDIWQVPKTETTPDSDFGASPVLFRGTIGGTVARLVGACNKNGVFYAWRRDDLAAGPVWRFREGNPDADGTSQCNAAAVWDGSHLFLAGGSGTVIGDVTYPGAIRSVDPSTGTALWETGLPGHVLGTPTLDGSGVLAVGSYTASGDTGDGVAAAWLIDAVSGAILTTLPTKTSIFAQPVFADRFVLVATLGEGLDAFSPIQPVGVSDSGFSVPALGIREGGTVRWDFSPSNSEARAASDASGMALFDSGLRAPGSSSSFTFASAGTYPVVDVSDGQAMTVSAPLQASPATGASSDSFTLEVAAAAPPSGFELVLQARRPGATGYRTLTRTQAPSVTFTPDAGAGTYLFRARLEKTVDHSHSGWSPSASVKVT